MRQIWQHNGWDGWGRDDSGGFGCGGIGGGYGFGSSIGGDGGGGDGDGNGDGFGDGYGGYGQEHQQEFIGALHETDLDEKRFR